MRSDITIDVSSARPDATDAFAISYRCPSPEIARDVTTELANRLISENMSAFQSVAAGEIQALALRSVELSAELQGMESKARWLTSLKEDATPGLLDAGIRRAAGSASQDVRRSHTNDLANLQDQQYKLRQQIREMDLRIAEQKQIVQKQKENPQERDGSSVGGLIAKRAELQGQRENYVKTQGLTEKHPRVVALDDQIDSINRAIAEVRRQHATSVSQTPEERELLALEFDRNKLKIEAEVADRQLDREQEVAPESNRIAVRLAGSLVPSDAGSARLAQDYVALRQSYKEVTARIQKARLDAEVIASGKVDRFRIIDEANLPEIPVSPNRRLLIFVSALLGVVLGLVSFLLLNLRKIRSLRDAEDVGYYTGLPLLGEIPLVTTPAERALRTRRLKIKFAVGAGIAAVAVLALSKVLLLSHFFELVLRR
jgi:LPS O-antigen subunit length determinant protein (WzzB/FepE family)